MPMMTAIPSTCAAFWQRRSKGGAVMDIAPMTKRDKILLYAVLMLAFIVLYASAACSRPAPI